MRVPRGVHRARMVLRRAEQRARRGSPAAGFRSPSHAAHSLTAEKLRKIRAAKGVGRSA